MRRVVSSGALALVLCALAGCGAGTSGSAAAPAGSAVVEMAPTPYTAAQIRAATRVGRSYEFRVEAEGKPAVRRIMTFTAVSDARAETDNRITDDDGKPLEGGGHREASWEELRKHAEFPRAQVTLHDETVVVPAGAFACTLYTVTEGSGAEQTVERFAFSKDMAGPPVQFSTDKGGRRVMTSKLVVYRAGP